MATAIGVGLMGIGLIGSIANFNIRSWKLGGAVNLIAFIGLTLVYAATH